jgi:hypothetical protein
MSLEKPDINENVDHGGNSGGSIKAGQVQNKRPYFGMTGTQLNVWITVACTTGMTLFGK